MRNAVWPTFRDFHFLKKTLLTFQHWLAATQLNYGPPVTVPPPPSTFFSDKIEMRPDQVASINIWLTKAQNADAWSDRVALCHALIDPFCPQYTIWYLGLVVFQAGRKWRRSQRRNNVYPSIALMFHTIWRKPYTLFVSGDAVGDDGKGKSSSQIMSEPCNYMVQRMYILREKNMNCRQFSWKRNRIWAPRSRSNNCCLGSVRPQHRKVV